MNKFDKELGVSDVPEVGPGVVVVDDEDDVSEVVAENFELGGEPVIRFSSGQEALRHMTKRGRGPKLVITDVNMPGMTGPELVQKLRGHACYPGPGFEGAPVLPPPRFIFMTGGQVGPHARLLGELLRDERCLGILGKPLMPSDINTVLGIYGAMKKTRDGARETTECGGALEPLLEVMRQTSSRICQMHGIPYNLPRANSDSDSDSDE